MTRRLLLALLAVLTGLSVQGSAVQARAMPAITMQVAAASALATVRSAKAASAIAHPVAAPAAMAQEQPRAGILPAAAPAVPACLTGIDRAHE